MFSRNLLRAIVFFLLACFWLFAARVARADPESDAKDLFERGRELRAHGDCAGAADLFKRAIQVFPSGLGSQRNLAECEETLEHFAQAKRAWLDLGRALSLARDPKYEGWTEDARSAVQRLLPRIAKLKVEVAVGTRRGEVPLAKGDAVDVILDGEVLDRALLGTEVERDPGPHEIRIEGAGVASVVSRQVVLVAGQSTTIKLAVTLRAGAIPKVASPHASPARALGWTLVGVGGAALIAAGVTLAVRQSALGDLTQACPNYETSACNPSVASTVSRGSLASTLTTAFGVAGLVGVAGGVTLILVAPRGKSVTVQAGLSAASVALTF